MREEQPTNKTIIGIITAKFCLLLFGLVVTQNNILHFLCLLHSSLKPEGGLPLFPFLWGSALCESYTINVISDGKCYIKTSCTVKIFQLKEVVLQEETNNSQTWFWGY